MFGNDFVNTPFLLFTTTVGFSFLLSLVNRLTTIFFLPPKILVGLLFAYVVFFFLRSKLNTPPKPSRAIVVGSGITVI